MLNKEEVFLYLNSGVDKSGYLKKEIGFSKKFPELYEEFLKVDFPEELKVFPFKQRLWHFLKDDYSIHTCKICGGKVSFSSNTNLYGYKTYCLYCSLKDNDIKNKSKKTCLEKYGVEFYQQTDESKKRNKQTCLKKYGTEYYSQTKEYKKKSKETCIEKYGVENPSQSKEIKEKIKETNLEKYGVKNVFQLKETKDKIKKTNLEKYGVEHHMKLDKIKEKIKETNLEKYGVENPSQSKKIKEKIKETNLEKYGVENYSQTEKFKNILNEKHDEIQQKRYDTKKNNHSFNSSKIEEEFKEYLTNNNIEFIPYYKSDLYPFECDFYIPYYDLYIEINGHWTHGKHPFNPNNKEDIKFLEELKSKCQIIDGKKNQYFNAVDVWTKRDPLKRQISKENNLNYLEIFSDKIEEVIKIFEIYI